MKTKSLDLESCSIKFAKNDEGILEGYLSVFGNVDSYGDTIFPGAYEKTLTERKNTMPMLLNHDSHGNVPIGIWKEMAEDDHGLRVVGEFTKGNSVAQNVFASVKHGAMSGLSIGYKAEKYEENDHGGVDLHEIKLREGSVVTFPADDHARIDTIKFDEAFEIIESVKDFEYALRDVGCSQKMAKTLVSQFKDVCQRDVGSLEEQIKGLKAELDTYHAAEQKRERFERLSKLAAV